MMKSSVKWTKGRTETSGKKEKIDVRVVQNLKKVHQENEWTGDDLADAEDVDGARDDEELGKVDEGEEDGEDEDEEEEEENESEGDDEDALRTAKRPRLAE